MQIKLMFITVLHRTNYFKAGQRPVRHGTENSECFRE